MTFEFADRIKRLPPYLFAEIEKIINEKKAQGVDLISLSIGDPDFPPPPFVVEALKQEVADLKNHNYSFSQGEPDFRQAVSEWYKKRFNVDLAHDQVVALLGSKEGIANIARAFINPGDHVLVPDPAYPVYANGSTILCDGVAVPMPLLEENGFQPDFEAIDAKKAKMMFINYPNNPTAATVDKKFLKEAVEFAKGQQHNPLLRQRLLGNHLRRLPSTKHSGNRWGYGCCHRVSFALKDFQHDRRPHRLCSRKQATRQRLN